MRKLIIGIDGGGTKSHLAVFDQNGKCVAVGKHGPLNHEVMEYAFVQLEKELSALIKDTLVSIDATPADVAFAVLGLAGMDTEKQHKIISAMVDRIGLSRYILCNDAFLGVPAGCPGGIGICAINGTGSTMAAVDHSGATVQVGGIGMYSNDCGGGSWFGTKLLGAVYGELFKCEKKTIMTEMLLSRLGVNDSKDYVETITTDMENDNINMCDLNLMFFDAVAKGDEVALDCLNESAGHYSGGIAHLANTLDFPDDRTLHITFAGSVFVKEKTKTLPRLIINEVDKKIPSKNLEFHMLKTVPVAGAVYWASKEAGFDIDINVISEALAEAGLE